MRGRIGGGGGGGHDIVSRGCRCMLFSLAAVVVFVIGRTMLIPFFLILIIDNFSRISNLLALSIVT